MIRIRTRLAIATLAIFLGACASNRSPQVGPMGSGSGEARVHVTNNNWSDMTVYVEGNGTRQRLGTVTSMATRVYKLPRSLLSSTTEVKLVADPIGGRGAHVTFPVQVWPGQRVDFTIQNQLTTSSVVVR